MVNNVVKEYLDQQYQYDAYGQLIRQKTSQGDLTLEWDVYGRMVKSRNSQYTAEYRYDALGRRIQKWSKHHHTGQEQNIIYGWDGDTLAYESTEELTKHYIYEKDSFVPMLQAVYLSPIELHQTPDWSDRPYNIHRDPLWKTEKEGKEFDDVWFYHCDHLGTPQEMTDHTGAIIWKAEYKAWGECKAEEAKSNFFENSEIISNNIRFQGQYFDEETGLHYNRYRYYSPYVGRFVSKDPIGLLGGNNVYVYAKNPITWIDSKGLCSTTLNRNLGGVKGDHLQAHHIIPEEIWAKRKDFLDDIGIGGNRDKAENGVLMPDSEAKAKQMKRQLYHCGSHPIYSAGINQKLGQIQREFESKKITASQARDKVANLQSSMRLVLITPGTKPIRLS
ncbi:RHS domain-containing protein [Acinetobacter baumannii]|nr:RHS domain-containing protein [Acinetobacter baumannii]